MKIGFSQIDNSRYYSTREYLQFACKDLKIDCGVHPKYDVVICFNGKSTVPAEKTLYYERDADREIQTDPEGNRFYSQHSKSWSDDRVIYHAADPNIHKRVEDPYLDIVSCGRNYDNRVAFINAINLDINNFGDGHTPEEYVKILSRGRILFNYSHRGEISRKPFENMAIGCCVTDRVKGLENIGVEGEHYFTYDREDPRSAKKVLQYLLDNPDEVERVTKNSREHIINKHTYKHRLVELLMKGNCL